MTDSVDLTLVTISYAHITKKLAIFEKSVLLNVGLTEYNMVSSVEIVCDFDADNCTIDIKFIADILPWVSNAYLNATVSNKHLLLKIRNPTFSGLTQAMIIIPTLIVLRCITIYVKGTIRYAKIVETVDFNTLLLIRC